MALGHYMREKSTESKGDSPAESTQTAETIESGKNYVCADSQRSRLLFPVVEKVLTQLRIQLTAIRQFLI